MTDGPEDLWNPRIGEGTAGTPMSLVRTQADLLEGRTGGLVVAEVVSPRAAAVRSDLGSRVRGLSSSDDNAARITSRLRIVAPKLGYRYEIAHFTYPLVSLYPVEMEASGGSTRADNEAQFLAAIAGILGSEDVTAVVNSLIAQSLALADPDEIPF